MNSNTNKDKKTGLFFLYLSSFIIFLLIFFSKNYSASLLSLGGALIFVPIAGGFYLLSYTVRPLALECSSIALMISGILAINFLGFLEKTDTKLFLNYFYLLFLCIFIIYYVFGLSFMNLIKQNYSLNALDKKNKENLFVILIGSFFVVMPFVLVFVNSASSGHIDYARHSLLNHSTLSLIFTISALIVTAVLLFKKSDKSLSQLIVEEKYHTLNYNSKKLKKTFYGLLLSVIFVGSILETHRGLWLLWIESILMLFLLFIIHWKIYKHIFKEKG